MRLRTALALTVLFAGVAGAGADQLVLRDGSRMETRGPWRQEGRLVVFTSADGRLASLRASDVDLEASRAATAAAVRPAAPEAAPAVAAAPRSVRRITNADIPRGEATPAGGEDEAAEPTAGGAAAAGAGEAAAAVLTVSSSDQTKDPADGHVVVTGTLANDSDDTVAGVRLTVHAFGPEGHLLASRPAELDADALEGEATTEFRVDFPDVYEVFALRFDTAGTRLRAAAGADAPAESAAPPAEPEPSP